MMSISVNHDKAKKKLLLALKHAKESSIIDLDSKHKEFIEDILSSNHKTYKYILVNALLAKATNSKIHPRALQAGSSLVGAYDARSLCHNVLVPFDFKYFDNKLGASNEPFLNKPARFPEISLSNAVRKGNDEITLNKLYNFLELIAKSTSNQSFLNLVYALKYILKIKVIDEIYCDTEKCISKNLLDFVIEYLKESRKGVSAASVTGALFSMIYDNVEVHPINQSGASSKEISDIDIKCSKEICLAVEVKDKIYTETDVKHAVVKSKKYLNKLIFATGNHAHCDIPEQDLMKNYSENNFSLIFIRVENLACNIIPLLTNDRCVKFLLNMKDNFNALKAHENAISDFEELAVKYELFKKEEE